jgi:5'-nucleotidase
MGGFNGIYIQTEGTGGPTDGTPGASDGDLRLRWLNSSPPTPAVGDFVEVTGAVSEFGTAPNTLTELTVENGGVIELAAPPAEPCHPLAAAYPTTTADARGARGRAVRSHEPVHGDQHLLNMNNFAEIGLATGGTPLDRSRPRWPGRAPRRTTRSWRTTPPVVSCSTTVPRSTS